MRGGFGGRGSAGSVDDAAANGEGPHPSPGPGAEVRVRCRMVVLMQRCVDAVHRRCGEHMPPRAQLRLLSVLQARPWQHV